jgi:hypothetical protein
MHSETWRHFTKHDSPTQRYFRGTPDTLVNLMALSLMIDEFGLRGAPMTMHFAFNFH